MTEKQIIERVKDDTTNLYLQLASMKGELVSILIDEKPSNQMIYAFEHLAMASTIIYTCAQIGEINYRLTNLVIHSIKSAKDDFEHSKFLSLLFNEKLDKCLELAHEILADMPLAFEVSEATA